MNHSLLMKIGVLALMDNALKKSLPTCQNLVVLDLQCERLWTLIMMVNSPLGTHALVSLSISILL